MSTICLENEWNVCVPIFLGELKMSACVWGYKEDAIPGDWGSSGNCKKN